MIRKITTSDDYKATALLMREVLCEQVYRLRHDLADGWTDHVCKTLKMREITPDDIVVHAVAHSQAILDMSGDDLKKHASHVLDVILRSKATK